MPCHISVSLPVLPCMPVLALRSSFCSAYVWPGFKRPVVCLTAVKMTRLEADGNHLESPNYNARQCNGAQHTNMQESEHMQYSNDAILAGDPF